MKIALFFKELFAFKTCWCQQRFSYSFWSLLCCPTSLPSFIIMAYVKLILEEVGQYDPLLLGEVGVWQVPVQIGLILKI